jgi:hypothetical protein
MVAAGALVAISLFAALSQGGFLVPKFRTDGGGSGGGGGYSLSINQIQNVSWRSWTVTGAQLTDTGSATPSDVKVSQVGLRRNEFQPGFNGPGRSLRRLTVAPGQEFDVVLVEKQDDCSLPPPITTLAQAQRYEHSRQNHEHTIPAVFTVATPLGTRSIATSFTVSCSLH